MKVSEQTVLLEMLEKCFWMLCGWKADILTLERKEKKQERQKQL